MIRTLGRIATSITFAFEGLAYLYRTQTNFWVHTTAAVLVLVLGAALGVRGGELAALALAIGLVLVTEAGNTAIEALVDLASPGFHPLAKVVKDVAAAAVLLAAITAAIVGALVFVPRLFAGQG